jgi:hypothetical protein
MDIGKGDIKDLNRILDSIVITSIKLSDLKPVNIDDKWSNSVSSVIESYYNLLSNTIDKSVSDKVLKNILVSIVDFSKMLNNKEVSWDVRNLPSKEWLHVLVYSIQVYDKILSNVREDIKFKTIKDIITGLVDVNNIITKRNMTWYGLPTEEWLYNFKNMIFLYNLIVQLVNDNVYDNKTHEKLRDIINNTIRINNSLNDGVKWNITNIPNEEWFTRVILMIRNIHVLGKLSTVDKKTSNNILRLFTLYKDIIDILRKTSKVDISLDNIFYVSRLNDLLNKISKEDNKHEVTGIIRDYNILINGFIRINDKLKSIKGVDYNTLANINQLNIYLKDIISSLPVKEDVDLFTYNTLLSSFVILNDNLLKTSHIDNEKIVDLLSMTLTLNEIISILPKPTDISSPFNELILTMEKLSELSNKSVNPIIILSNSIRQLGKSLNSIDLEYVNRLTTVSDNIKAISLIDFVKLNNVMESIKSKDTGLSTVVSENENMFNRGNENKRLIDVFDNIFGKSDKEENSYGLTDSDESYRNKLISLLESIDSKLDLFGDKKQISEGKRTLLKSILGYS